MAAKVGWTPSYTDSRTLRELVISYDTVVFDQWNHTAVLAAQIYNLSVLVVNMTGKSKVKPRTPDHFHPFMETKIKGAKITKENFSLLRLFAGACSH